MFWVGGKFKIRTIQNAKICEINQYLLTKSVFVETWNIIISRQIDKINYNFENFYSKNVKFEWARMSSLFQRLDLKIY